MGIYIKGMEMPSDEIGQHKYKDIRVWYDGEVEALEGYWFNESSYKAIPVPPHGRLIDADALWVNINEICDRHDNEIITDLTCLQQILSAVRHTSTVIPAEEGE